MLYLLFEAIYLDALLLASLDKFVCALRPRKGLVSIGLLMRFLKQTV
jgi:hypothetical protein